MFSVNSSRIVIQINGGATRELPSSDLTADKKLDDLLNLAFVMPHVIRLKLEFPKPPTAEVTDLSVDNCHFYF